MSEEHRVWIADFVVFGRRTWRSKKVYTHAYGALRNPADPAWNWEEDIYIGFSGSLELAQRQVSKRRHQGWIGPFEVVETKENSS
jgi:hypothetical protein